MYVHVCIYVSNDWHFFKAIVPCTTFLVRQRTSTICIGSHDFSDMDIADAEETKSNEGHVSKFTRSHSVDLLE